jgi:hypothetical protein
VPLVSLVAPRFREREAVKLNVISDGNPFNMRVVDAKSGETVENVRRVVVERRYDSPNVQEVMIEFLVIGEANVKAEDPRKDVSYQCMH